MVTAPTTLRDIARACGVSVSTVSRALANNPAIAKKTRETIQAIAKELDYRPNAQARALKSSRTDAIGLVVPSLINPRSEERRVGKESRYEMSPHHTRE